MAVITLVLPGLGRLEETRLREVAVCLEATQLVSCGASTPSPCPCLLSLTAFSLKTASALGGPYLSFAIQPLTIGLCPPLVPEPPAAVTVMCCVHYLIHANL